MLLKVNFPLNLNRVVDVAIFNFTLALLDHLLMVVGGHRDDRGATDEVDLLSLDPSTGYNLPDCIKNSALAKYPFPVKYTSAGLAGGKGDKNNYDLRRLF